MNNFFMAAILSLVAKIDLYALAEVFYRAALKKIPKQVLDRINELVRNVDDLDLPGEEKFKEVMRSLRDPKSSIRFLINGIPQKILLIAIQGAYDKFKAG